jgi:hypothetical protein
MKNIKMLALMAMSLAGSSLGGAFNWRSQSQISGRFRNLPKQHRRLREQIRATRQGLHNTTDGRIERLRGITVIRGKTGEFCAIPRDVWFYSHNNYGFGDTRAEAIANLNNTFLHPEIKP